MSSNSAAWLMAEKADPFKIDAAPMPTPGDDQIVIRNHAVAINPVDGVHQKLAFFPLHYPTILGQDVAGVVEAVGSNVTRFKKGDRVLGHGVGFSAGSDAESAFQKFTLLRINLVTEIPDELSFENAAVVPLGCSTAACAMFQKDFLNMQFPTEPRQKTVGQSILIWGGSSSVGCNAIQLAVAAGYEVITTASPRNFELVKKLGASQVFDYNEPTVVEDIVKALKGKNVVGVFDCISGLAWTPCFEIANKITGVKCVVSTRFGWHEPPEDVTVKYVVGSSLKDNEVGKAIYEDFLPKALRSGTFVSAPEPLIVGKGLEYIQTAVHRQAEGISAQKVVVSL